MPSYAVEELVEALDEIDFDEESDARGPVLEATLRVCYELPNIGHDTEALRAVLEYGASQEGDRLTLEEISLYAGLFVQWYQDWEAVADHQLVELFDGGIQAFYKHMDMDAIGRGLGGDLGGYWGVEDGRVAEFNKREGA